MERGDEIESTTIRAVLKTDNDKDVYDLIEEVDNFIGLFKDYKAEILEDLCQVIGIQIDRYVMDQYELMQKKKQQNK